MQRERHGRLHDARGDAGVGDRAGEDERRRGTHGVARAESQRTPDRPARGGQHDVAHRVELGATERVGGLDERAGHLVEALLHPDLDEGNNHDRERHARGEDAASPGEVAHEQGVGEEPEHDGGDPRHALHDAAHQRAHARAGAEELHVDGSGDGGDAAEQAREQREPEASRDRRHDSAPLAQDGPGGSLRQELPADDPRALEEHVAEEEERRRHDEGDRDRRPQGEGASAPAHATRPP